MLFLNTFKFRTGKTFTGGGERNKRSYKDTRNYSVSAREDNDRTAERAKPRYLLRR